MKRRRSGFTLIELALSMALVGVISIIIAVLVSDTVASYQRGLTLNQINTIGMDIVDDVRTAVQNASGRSVEAVCREYYAEGSTSLSKCVGDRGSYFVKITKTGQVRVKGFDGDTSGAPMTVPLYGAFCTGTYSYIWNSGYFMADNVVGEIMDALGNVVEPATLTYPMLVENEAGEYVMKNVRLVGDFSHSQMPTLTADVPDDEDLVWGDASKPFRLLKVKDTQRGVCASVVRPYEVLPSGGIGYSGSYGRESQNDWLNDSERAGKFTMTGYGSVSNNDMPTDLILADSANDLALYDLSVNYALSATQKNTFYATSMIIGTLHGGINITAAGKSCAAPNDYMVENFDYCAINKFNFAVQAIGE